MTFLFYLSLIAFLIVCGLLSFVILIQESKSMGLGAAFGSDHGSSVFGTSTADVLKKFTTYVALIFVILCVTLSVWSSAGSKTVLPTPHIIEQSVSE
ncbi:MAG: preprotein translocase subunit SecG [Rhabdochlamydiaceae bacterium]|nr:preprotein translocase subunit SecG [Candidatus Amphrikana amoebophyrae]